MLTCNLSGFFACSLEVNQTLILVAPSYSDSFLEVLGSGKFQTFNQI